MKNQLILINHIGTSDIKTLETELIPFVKTIEAMGVGKVVLTFNSKRAIAKLSVKGIEVPTLDEALVKQQANFDKVVVLPLHMVGGKDFDDVLKCVERIGGEHVTVTLPILQNTDQWPDLIQVIRKMMPADEKQILMVVHGSAHSSDHRYDVFKDAFEKTFVEEQINCFLYRLGDEDGLASLPDGLFMIPMFSVAGHHVKKDIFEDENSIYHQLLKRHKKVRYRAEGLLEDDAFQALYKNVLREG